MRGWEKDRKTAKKKPIRTELIPDWFDESSEEPAKEASTEETPRKLKQKSERLKKN